MCVCVYMRTYLEAIKNGECTVEEEEEIQRERGGVADLGAEEGEEGDQTKRETGEGSGEEERINAKYNIFV